MNTKLLNFLENKKEIYENMEWVEEIESDIICVPSLFGINKCENGRIIIGSELKNEIDVAVLTMAMSECNRILHQYESLTEDQKNQVIFNSSIEFIYNGQVITYAHPKKIFILF